MSGGTNETSAMSETPNVLHAARLRVVGFTALLALGTAILCANKDWSAGWTAAFLSYATLFSFAAHCVWRRDKGFARLVVFGFVFGVGELIADALCVLFTQTLDYSSTKSPMVWHSPFWMPLAWLAVSVQIGYWGTHLMKRFGSVRGALLTALIGAVNIPFYEQMAYHTHWWAYKNCLMINHAPVYVIVAELFIGAALAPLARIALRGPHLSDAVWAGLLGGLSTIVGGLIGYGMVEKIPQWLGF